MTRKSILDEYHYEKLTVNHDLNDFSCGNDDLDEFLKKDALPQQEKNLNVTYLAMRRKEILGFISISAENKDDLEELTKHIRTIAMKHQSWM